MDTNYKQMKTKLLFLIMLLIFGQTNIFGQNELERNFPLTRLYNNEGNISIEHVNDGVGNGYEKTFLHVYAPFYATQLQTFALQSGLQKKSLVGDQILQANLGLAWKFTILEDLHLIAGINGTFSQFTINNSSNIGNNADVLTQYQEFSSSSVSASLGILHDYFWTIGTYKQEFSFDNQYVGYEAQILDATLGFKFITNDWEFRLPIQAFDLINFNENLIFGGLLVSYKGNYLYGGANLLGNMSFELGLRPYSWLSIGLIYELNHLTTTSGYGVLGAYKWKSQKLTL